MQFYFETASVNTKGCACRVVILAGRSPLFIPACNSCPRFPRQGYPSPSLRQATRIAPPSSQEGAPPRDMGTDLKIKSPPNTRRAFYYIAINRSSYSAAFSSAAGASAAGVAGASAAGAAASAAAGAALFFERRVRVAFLAAFSLSMFSL